MKILYIANELSRRNGWAVINYYTACGAAAAGCKVTVATAHNACNESIAGIDVYPILTSLYDGYFKCYRAQRDACQLQRLVKIGNYDVIHILVEPYLPMVLFMRPKKTVLSIVGTYAVAPFRKWPNKFFYRCSLKKVSSIIAVSEYTARQFETYNAAHIPVHIIPLGVDMGLFSHPMANNTCKKESAFCFVGHIKSRKGLLYAIQAVELLVEAFPSIKLYVIGGDDSEGYVAKCKQYINEKQLWNHIIFLGALPQEDIKQYYQRCVANVLPSVNEGDYFEGFGLIHLEANAAGIPTIGSRNCGNESAIIDGFNGFLCPQGDVAALAGRMAYLLKIKDTPEYAALCRQSKEHALRNSWDVYIQKVLAAYR